MGFYRQQIVPRLVDRACGSKGMERWRAQVTAGLAGRVVEIGFGSGLNAPHYPPEVEVVLAIEPVALARRLAQDRIAECHVPIEHVGLDGQSIALPDGSCDDALTTFTLCTVPDPALVLSELHRVIRVGGGLHFLEHGLSPDPRVATWQHRLDPLERRLADGCHLTRDAGTMIRSAGFAIDTIEQRYAKGPKPWSWFTVGTATRV
jgi:ubiquinone/menaquinone biosynthesis C-methylase UbiE